jgi:hypothetical protein
MSSLIAEITNAIVIILDPLILPPNDGFHLWGKAFIESLFISTFGSILTALAFLQDGVFIHSSDG